MVYSDFLIRAREWREGEILVEVNASPAGRMRDPQRAPLDRATVLPFLRDLEQKIPRGRLIELGQLLADALLPAVVREMLTRSLDSLEPEKGLRLRLVLDDPSLAALPWEYLHRSRAGGEPGLDGFLVLDRRISIVRDEPIPLPALPLAAAPRLRLVVGFAAPEDAPPLDLDAERVAIAQALEGLDRFEVSFVECLTAETIGPAVEGAGAFHFAGHGGFSEKHGPEGFLVLEDERRRSFRFPAELLAALLRAAGVRLVVLNSCKGGRRGGARVWGGLAAVLTKAGIPAVLAMQASIHHESAVRFSRGLVPRARGRAIPRRGDDRRAPRRAGHGGPGRRRLGSAGALSALAGRAALPGGGRAGRGPREDPDRDPPAGGPAPRGADGSRGRGDRRWRGPRDPGSRRGGKHGRKDESRVAPPRTYKHIRLALTLKTHSVNPPICDDRSVHLDSVLRAYKV